MAKVNYVTISGNEYPVRFSRAAFARWSKDARIAAEDMESGEVQLTMLDLYQIFYAAIRDGFRKEKRRFPFRTVEDLIDLLEEDEDNEGKAQEDLMTLFDDAQAKSEQKAGGTKKK